MPKRKNAASVKVKKTALVKNKMMITLTKRVKSIATMKKRMKVKNNYIVAA